MPELSTQENVGESNVPDDNNKVEHLAQQEQQKRAGVPVPRVREVLDDRLELLLLVVTLGHVVRAELANDFLESLALQVAPDVVRKVEQDGLEEEDERDPLVIRVVLFLRCVWVDRSDSWMDDFSADVFDVVFWERVRRRNLRTIQIKKIMILS